jgi:hypothetical protein
VYLCVWRGVVAATPFADFYRCLCVMSETRFVCSFAEMPATSSVGRNRFARMLYVAGLLVYCGVAAGRVSCVVIQTLHVSPYHGGLHDFEK